MKVPCSSKSCCAASCGKCGGPGCSQRPGGVSRCCDSGVRASGRFCEDAGPPCIRDRPAGNCGPTVCCALGCGKCGGEGCSRLPGGAENCCVGDILGSGRSCDRFSPPCIR